MKDVLDPLTRLPGVRLALIVSEDGVPIASAKGESSKSRGDEEGNTDSDEELEAFCGLAAGWYDEVHRAVDPLSWDRPSSISMRCARGTLVMQSCERAILAVLLHRGVVVEELRLPMGSAAARLERNRRRGVVQETSSQAQPSTDGPPGLFPGVSQSPDGSGADVNSTNEVPETSGER